MPAPVVRRPANNSTAPPTAALNGWARLVVSTNNSGRATASGENTTDRSPTSRPIPTTPAPAETARPATGRTADTTTASRPGSTATQPATAHDATGEPS